LQKGKFSGGAGQLAGGKIGGQNRDTAEALLVILSLVLTEMQNM
jgi:hypothetical protein